MSDSYTKKQENAKLHREFTLRLFRQEYEKHGHSNPLRATPSTERAPRKAQDKEMGSSGMSSTFRQDGNGD